MSSSIHSFYFVEFLFLHLNLIYCIDNVVLEKETEIRTMSPQLTAEASKQSSNAEETIKSQSSADNQLDRPVSMELPIDLNTDNCEVNLTPAAFFKPEQVTKQISENNVVSTAWSSLLLPHRYIALSVFPIKVFQVFYSQN